MDAAKLKVAATVAILLVGAVLGVTFANGNQPDPRQSEGLIIDYGGYDVQWTDAALSEYDSADSLLVYACDVNSLSLTRDAGGNVTEINGTANDATHSWGCWVIEKGTTQWVRADGSAVPSQYLVVAWAYCSESEEPAVALDAGGNSIHGYSQARKVVSLAPAITEIIGSLNAVTTLVGADYYSNYPHSVVEGKASGEIAVTGGYTNPSFESITKLEPDMVFCDSSQYTHNEIQRKLTDCGYSAVLLYDGQDIDTILDNIFIVGTVMGYEMAAVNVINDIRAVMASITDAIGTSLMSQTPSALIALSADKAPWASGSYTYADDAVAISGGSNILSGMDGWVHINPEMISSGNPQVIIILDSSGGTLSYDSMLENMSAEWKSTDAYKNGRVYLFTDGAADLAQRPSPRVAQFTELVARILQPDVFTDIEIPKVIGDDCANYLNYSKDMSYDN